MRKVRELEIKLHKIEDDIRKMICSHPMEERMFYETNLDYYGVLPGFSARPGETTFVERCRRCEKLLRTFNTRKEFLEAKIEHIDKRREEEREVLEQLMIRAKDTP